MTIVLIQRLETGSLRRIELSRPKDLADFLQTGPPEGVLVASLRPLGIAIAALFVPDDCSGRVTRNGEPLNARMHLLEHGDQIQFARHVFWIAAEAHAEHARYDPAQHGPDMACYLTQSRILPGEEIVICPGLPGRACGVIYKAKAWELAMQSARSIRCRNCGFHPLDASWNPPACKERTGLDELLRLAR